MRKVFILSFLFFQLSSAIGFGQSNYEGIAASVQLDSFMITAEKQGFKVEEFIEIVQKDSSFRQAFENIRLFEHQISSKMVFYKGERKEKATFYQQMRQKMINNCRYNLIDEKRASGDFYKKDGSYRYLTAEMYDRVFFTKDTICPSQAAEVPAKGMQKYYNELKQFIFQPGEQVDVPLVSKKTALFETHLQKYYEYTITQDQYKGVKNAYAFTITIKPEYAGKKTNKTLIKYLKTYFEPESFQVLGRVYDIVYKGLASCDVHMEVDLTQIEGIYLLQNISYEGTWNIPGKKRETGTFTARLDFN